MNSKQRFFWQNLLVIGLLSACGSGKDSDTGDTSDTSDTTDTAEPDTILTQGIHQEMSSFSGCGDIAMAAATPTDEAALLITALGLAEEAFAEGAESTSFTLAVGNDDGQAQLRLQGGERLTVEFCNDVIMEGHRPDVQEELQATSGSIEFVIRPDGEATDWGEFLS